MTDVRIKKEPSIIEVMEFMKKYGTKFSIIDKNTIEISMRSGNTKVYYLDDSGNIIGSAEYLREEE